MAAVLSGNRDIALRSAAVWLGAAPASCPVSARHLSTAQTRSEESRNGPSVDRIELDASSASTTSRRTDVAPPSASATAFLTGGTLSGASQSNRLRPWSSSGDSKTLKKNCQKMIPAAQILDLVVASRIALMKPRA